MAFSMAMSWNEGEEKMHKLLRVPAQDNPTSSMLTPQASFMFQRAPLLALGTLDAESRPWTTLWGGSSGFSQPLGGGLIGTRTLVDGKNDPVVQALVGGAEIEKTPHPNGDGKLLAGLAIDLMTRKRVKVAGRMAAGTMRSVDVEVGGEPGTKQEQLQLVTKIEQSLGNCPKYLNQYELQPALVNSTLISQSTSLSNEAKALISNSDMFFLTTSTKHDMDVNHRGGPPGFVRIISPTQIAYPEYSGNRLYQSLGNLQLNPKLGLTFPNYTTGSILYLTGEAEILVGGEAASLLPSSTLAVKITIREMRYITHGLPFRGTKSEQSPYNPPIRILASEGNIKSSLTHSSPHQPTATAHLLTKTPLTPTITRFTFSAPPPFHYTPSQWLALDFSQDLDIGYEHMRDSDPKSLNDDFTRTFTISSPPPSPSPKETQFEITIRNTGGPVTSFLAKQNPRAGCEIPIRGIGGGFVIHQDEEGITPFVAGGVGITPLLAQLPSLNLLPTKFKLFWAVRREDVGLVRDTFLRYPGLGKCAEAFFTGDSAATDGEMEQFGAKYVNRRLEKGDVDAVRAETWYVCAGKGLRRQVSSWLEGKKVVSEDFDY